MVTIASLGSRLRPRLAPPAVRSACFLAAIGSTPALAHGGEGAFVLLLPTGYYIFGGTLAVAASFLLIAFAPADLVQRVAGTRRQLGTIPAISPVPTSLAAFLFFAFLLSTGIYGTPDPLQNPLPLTIWTLWWVGLTLLHPVFGNLWAFLNPWSGPQWLLKRLVGPRVGGLSYPEWLSYWPALVLFFGFAWFELVDPAPDNPERLAIAAGCYWLFAFAGLLAFGKTWTEKAEPFSIFFRLVAGLSPLSFVKRADGRARVALVWPGVTLLERPPLPLSGVLFVILTLSSVSFDGLSRTFWWLALGGINPLEFPGRTAMVDRNTFGLLLAFATLVAAYWLAVRLGWFLAGMRAPLMPALGALVHSIIPISIAFHFAHYLTVLMVNAQYALASASDPFGNGLDLFGTRDRYVTTVFLNTYGPVRLIWTIEVFAIVLGHIFGIALAHALATRHFAGGRKTIPSQLPLAALMVLYTLFGLWLLSTPTAG
jgi:hypothetical protein